MAGKCELEKETHPDLAGVNVRIIQGKVALGA